MVPFEGITWLEKADSGKVTVEDISDALEEFARLFKAGIASKAEKLTLSRAFPTNRQYTEAVTSLGDEEPMVVGGPASVSLIDREGHLITTDALKKAFTKFMGNFRTRNAMVLHSDVQVGWALPAYITKGGQIFKSGVDDKGLFFICELRDDTKISEKVMKEISEGRLKSYSIAGSALKVQNMQKGLVPYMQVDDMELAEVTVCEKGVNQQAGFELLKAEMPQTGKIDKDQCDYRDATEEEAMRGENCGHCKFFNAQDKTCDTVAGDIQPGDWCKIFQPMAQQPTHTKVVLVMRNNDKVDFKKSFDMWMSKAETVKDPLQSKESLATLQNFAGREAEHHQLLREYGFPSEQPAESARYNPVIETETDEDGAPINIRPPWVVNEAGQDLGEKLDEDSPDYHQSAKAKNRKSGEAVQKMGFLFKAPNETYAQRVARRRMEAEEEKGRQQKRQRESLNQAEKERAQRTSEQEQDTAGQERQERVNATMDRAKDKPRSQFSWAKKPSPDRRFSWQQERGKRDAEQRRTPSQRRKRAFQRFGRGVERAAAEGRERLGALPADVAREGGRFGRGLGVGYRGKGRLQEKVGERVPTAARAGKRTGRAVESMKRAFGGVGRGLAGQDYRAQMAGEGQAGQRGRAVGSALRRGWGSKTGQDIRDVLIRQGRSKDEMKQDKTMSGNFVMPGGAEGRAMSWDDHHAQFQQHNAEIQRAGHSTHGDFLENLQRLGWNQHGGDAIFNVRYGKHMGSKLNDRLHANDFWDGHGKDWDYQINPKYSHLADEIHAQVGEYAAHHGKAPAGSAFVPTGGSAGPMLPNQTPDTSPPPTDAPTDAPTPAPTPSRMSRVPKPITPTPQPESSGPKFATVPGMPKVNIGKARRLVKGDKWDKLKGMFGGKKDEFDYTDKSKANVKRFMEDELARRGGMTAPHGSSSQAEPTEQLAKMFNI